jgi:hypothetical protein
MHYIFTVAILAQGFVTFYKTTKQLPLQLSASATMSENETFAEFVIRHRTARVTGLEYVMTVVNRLKERGLELTIMNPNAIIWARRVKFPLKEDLKFNGYIFKDSITMSIAFEMMEQVPRYEVFVMSPDGQKFVMEDQMMFPTDENRTEITQTMDYVCAVLDGKFAEPFDDKAYQPDAPKLDTD